MMKKFPIVHIKFLDHCLTDGTETQPISCEVMGYLTHEDKGCYVVASWVCDSQVNSENNEVFVIVKHPGVKKRVLR